MNLSVGVACTTLGDALRSLASRRGTTRLLRLRSVQVSDHRRHRQSNVQGLHPNTYRVLGKGTHVKREKPYISSLLLLFPLPFSL
ncbi:hypothetical protein NSTCB13_01456 [Nostoc sp. DSM 114160]|jgi:hypothetical protein